MKQTEPLRLRFIDSHTGGEPTRLIVDGFPDLGTGSLMERRERLRNEFDAWRRAIVNEPRGPGFTVGALLCKPVDSSCATGVIFFNSAGCIGMCGHGTIGLVVSLAWLGRLKPGVHRIETPVGVVGAQLHDNGTVTVENVPAKRTGQAVAVNVPGVGQIVGDVAWGGNWFFLVAEHGQRLDLDNVEQLTHFTSKIRDALAIAGITGDDGGEIDHVELFGPPVGRDADARNFVLCPGQEYDRSPCGTGTSAKLACLVADGKLVPGQKWRQQSITGSIFTGSARIEGAAVIPSIQGSAHVTLEGTLIIDPADPFAWGLDHIAPRAGSSGPRLSSTR